MGVRVFFDVFRKNRSPLPAPADVGVPAVEVHASQAAYLEMREARREELHARHAVEQSIANLARCAPFQYLCHAHGGTATLRLGAQEGDEVNWRESVVCPTCHLNARMRFCTGLLARWMQAQPGARLYLTEQATYGYALLKRRFGTVRGSEYIHDEARKTAVGQYIRQITGDPAESLNIEDVTRLSFADASFEVLA